MERDDKEWRYGEFSKAIPPMRYNEIIIYKGYSEGLGQSLTGEMGKDPSEDIASFRDVDEQ